MRLFKSISRDDMSCSYKRNISSGRQSVYELALTVTFRWPIRRSERKTRENITVFDILKSDVSWYVLLDVVGFDVGRRVPFFYIICYGS